ncbi:MAG: zinc ribbon domain-containing protein [Prevotella sp.]|nr:zinc ribbon domain-containing protein [Prevotella sp.]
MKKCVYCQSDMSDQAAFCPRCGKSQPQQTMYRPAQQPQQPQQPPVRQPEKSKSNGALWAVIGFLAAAVLGLGGWIVYENFIKENSTPTTTVTATTSDTEKKTEKEQKKEKKESKKVSEEKTTQSVKNTPKVIRGTYNLTGAISKYPITMNISITDGDVVGTYYYHSQGRNNKMTVNGTISADRRMILEEYAPSGLNTGYFDGYFNGEAYTGQFSNYEKDSHLSFSLNTY